MLALRRERECRPGLTLFALDVPSGLDADTGAVDPACPGADVTVAFGYPKTGLYMHPGADAAGVVEVVDIGLPPGLDEDVSLRLMTADWAAGLLPRRASDAHKGSFGKTLVVAGSRNYAGAAYLACAGAMRAGAGLVTVAAPRMPAGVDPVALTGADVPAAARAGPRGRARRAGRGGRLRRGAGRLRPGPGAGDG